MDVIKCPPTSFSLGSGGGADVGAQPAVRSLDSVPQDAQARSVGPETGKAGLKSWGGGAPCGRFLSSFSSTPWLGGGATLRAHGHAAGVHVHMRAQALTAAAAAAAGELPRHPQRVPEADMQLPADPSLPPHPPAYMKHASSRVPLPS